MDCTSKSFLNITNKQGSLLKSSRSHCHGFELSDGSVVMSVDGLRVRTPEEGRGNHGSI